MDWKQTLDAYEAIAVVANSEAAKTQAARDALPKNTLFIFFNDVRRVLSSKFDAPAIVVLRSGKAGPAVVRKGRMGEVLQAFATGALKLIVNLRCAEIETPAEPHLFRFPRVEYLDLVQHFQPLYTAGKTPSSGYAVLAWMHSLDLNTPIYACGFTAQRSEKWKVFDVHDWAFEQVAYRMFIHERRVIPFPETPPRPTATDALIAQFPDVDPLHLTQIGYEVLSQRIERSDMFIDRLWSVTKLGRSVRRGLELLRR